MKYITKHKFTVKTTASIPGNRVMTPGELQLQRNRASKQTSKDNFVANMMYEIYNISVSRWEEVSTGQRKKAFLYTFKSGDTQIIKEFATSEMADEFIDSIS